MNTLDRILARKELEFKRRQRYRALLERMLATQPLPIHDPLPVLRRGSGDLPRLIAELKFRSPSRGEIRAHTRTELPSLVQAYLEADAQALSTLADYPGFGGSPLHVREVARLSGKPVLFKEFVLDPIQVMWARAVGASMVLLLVCALDDARLRQLVREVRALGMEPVVEAANRDELARALATEATIIGINARDLRSFAVDMHKMQDLLAVIPLDRIAVWMSGVHTQEDFARVQQSRADALLMGEALMRHDSPAAALRAMQSP